MRIINIALVAVILLAPALAFAQTRHDEQSLYKQKTSLTKYPVGACVDNEGGLWQQISDGTWAPPNDILNTCRTQGMYQSWTNNPETNPWLRSGMGYDFPKYQLNPGSYPYGLNYPGPNGGYMDYNEWFRRCVVMQTILPLPECQAFPSIGNQTTISMQIGAGSSKKSSTFWKIALAVLTGHTLSRIF